MTAEHTLGLHTTNGVLCTCTFKGMCLTALVNLTYCKYTSTVAKPITLLEIRNYFPHRKKSSKACDKPQRALYFKQ